VPNSDRVADVANGTVDIVAEAMTITCAREQMIDFSAEYYDAHQKVLVTKGSGINSEAALGGKRICAAQGSTSLTTLADDIKPTPILWAVANETDCLVMLQQGQVDAISTDDTILEGLATQDPNLQILNNVNLSDEPYGMGISKSHPDFTRFVNGVLAEEVADGQWQKTWDTWLSGVVKTPAPAAPKPLYRN